MDLFFFHSPLNDLKDKAMNKMEVIIYELPHSIIEGFEFLDHALRIKDKPIMLTETCVAVGCPYEVL